MGGEGGISWRRGGWLTREGGVMGVRGRGGRAGGWGEPKGRTLVSRVGGAGCAGPREGGRGVK